MNTKRLLAICSLALAQVACGGVVSPVEYMVDKTCTMPFGEIHFSYKVSPHDPDSPAEVTFRGEKYEGIAQQGAVIVIFPEYLGGFYFTGKSVRHTLVSQSKEYWLGEGTCTT